MTARFLSCYSIAILRNGGLKMHTENANIGELTSPKETHKYELTKNKTIVRGVTVYQILALKNFSDVKKGDLGGYVSHERNLPQDDNSWIYDNAAVFGNSFISGNATIHEYAIVGDNAVVSDDAIIGGNAEILEAARVYEQAIVGDNARVSGNAHVRRTARIVDYAQIKDYTLVSGNYIIGGHSIVSDDTELVDE